MDKIRFTSPGKLLICAIALAGGIVALDVIFLRPYVTEQKISALREQAVKVQRGVRQDLRASQNVLQAGSRAMARSVDVRDIISSSNRSEAFKVYLNGAMWSDLANNAWITDKSGQIVATWSSGKSTLSQLDQLQSHDEQFSSPGIMQSIKILRTSSQDGDGVMGLVHRDSNTLIIAGYIIRQGSQKALGWLWVAQPINSTMLKQIGLANGCEVMLVASQTLPSSTLTEGNQAQSVWMSQDDQLAIAWRLDDAEGQSLGYLRADVSAVQINRQADSARRMVLIILTLSVGLVLLVIVGTHILIAGPVLRLLRRLQNIESGQGELVELTDDLHGEPLIIARRLESAFERLDHMSKTDELTGLSNRRHFERVLECFYHQARRYNRPLSMIIMDVDFFKVVNDSGGHQAGDEMLNQVAKAVECVCRQADLPARLGGDEFAILLPETTCADAQKVAQRMLKDVPTRTVTVGSLELNVTLSIGVTDLNAGEIDSPQAMVVLADRALYLAKESGRDQIFLAQDIDLQSVEGRRHENRQVDVLCKKLAGLDSEFKSLFLRAVEQVVSILEHRDPNMADHARKVERFAALIAQQMELPDRLIQRIRVAAMLHDIGMLALPDSVLLCPTGLDDEHLRQMRRHTLLSVRVMERMEFLEQEIPAVRYHHERFDGKGYPEGIAGAAIPLTARILAVADAFEAITSPRTFRKAKTKDEALKELKLAAGTQFDPTVIDAMLAVADNLGEELLVFEDSQERMGGAAWRETIEDEIVEEIV